MAWAIHKTTLEYRPSVDVTELPGAKADWLINPQLPKCDRRDWKVEGGKIVEMSVVEKTARDAAELAEYKIAKLEELAQQVAVKTARSDAAYLSAKADVDASKTKEAVAIISIPDAQRS